jgi:hypothetical protein
MKLSTSKAMIASLFFLSILFFSCKKETTSTISNPLQISSNEISDADAPGLYKTTSGDFKLVLQPGDHKGQDAWIEYSPDDVSYATHNSGSIDQFKVLAWTDGGKVIISRSLLRFTDLSQIPTTSYIKQATLFLHGLDAGSVHLPQGNSYYPGSPYRSFGPNDTYIRKITSDWDESSVTWNNKPSTTVNYESLISPSTKQWNDNISADVTQIVKTFVKDPSKNYGFMLQLNKEKIYNSYGFYSSESSEPLKRPKLVIIYSN